MAMELLYPSPWAKNNNPAWEEKWNASVERIQANADLIQSANIMLDALLAAQRGDNSKIDEAILHATA